MRILLVTFLFTLFACINAQEDVKGGCTNYTGTPSLVLWTYSSFMTDPNYINFTYRFEDAKGLPRGSVVLCRMKSVDLNKHLGGPPPPGYLAPNIIIGLDTILETLNNDTHLVEFDTPHLDDMVPIVTTLGHYGHMKPYDWGLVAIWYNQSVVLELNRADDNRTFNLQTFLDSGLVSRLVTSDPTRDTAGLAFFMWTVAELGDAKLNQTGKINYQGGWQAWWRQAFERGLTIVDSWTEAIKTFYDPTKYSDIMASYGASPAYGWCLYGEKDTRSIVSWFNQTRFGWAQVEGYVLVNDTAIARQFIDYFISPALQDYIALHQFMNPVNKKAKIEQCFIDVAIQPQNVTLYNTFPIADIQVVTERMTAPSGSWFDEWKALYKAHYNPYVAPTTAPSTAPSTGTSTNTSTGTSGSNNTNGSERMHPIMILASIIMLIMIAIM